MSYSDWVDERYPDGIIASDLGGDDLEEAWQAGWDAAQEYLSEGGSFK